MSRGPFPCAVLLVAIPTAATPSQEIVVHRRELPQPVVEWRASLREGRPALRGFRAPLLLSPAPPGEPWSAPIDLPRDETSRRAAGLVSKRLARDGLLYTAAAALEALGVSPQEREGETERLCALGLPVDWLEYFELPGSAGAGARGVVRALAAALDAGASADTLRATCAGAAFIFRPSLEGFAVATESGEHDTGLVRLQLTSGSYWIGPGDGGCLDLARQLLDALPEADFVASIEEKHLAGLLETARSWPLRRERRLTVIPETLPVAQWAQDSGKPGLAPARSADLASGRLEPVLLVPRYASRGEAGAIFVPGETFLAESFASAGHRVVQSPLLFQGGNLLAARDPASGERLLFIGEADLWRNTAVGLSRDQALAAFRAEFGVDRCEVLPAVSFHIDQELSLRAVEDRLVALVPDTVAATRIVLACGLGALESAGVLSAAQAGRARADLEAGREREFLSSVMPEVTRRSLGFGRYSQMLADAFARGQADSGVGNLQRFLFALDVLESGTSPQDEEKLDPHSSAYLRSLRRRDSQRSDLAATLHRAGLSVERVPSLPDTSRGIDYLNGVHVEDRYLMPGWGGLYEPLDRAAQEAIRRALGPEVVILPILCSESQRRGGALHCSISPSPRP